MLLSACLIVRDEEATLPTCLAALSGVVDEIVVHDTGSTDNTVALALAAGAVVIRGEWNDDFAAARNVALQRCSGEWILHVDADEVLAVPDVSALRRALAAEVADGLLVGIDNLLDSGLGAADAHVAVRLFRRCAGRWHGRIHEQVVGTATGRLRTAAAPAGVRIAHTGYASAQWSEQKVARNLRLAQTVLAEASDEQARVTAGLDVGRALLAAGDLHAAATHFDAALDGAARATTEVRVALLRHAAQTALALGRADRAAALVRDYAAASPVATGAALVVAAQVHLARGDGTAALALLDAVEDPSDDSGYTLPAGLPALQRALAAALTGDWTRAADAAHAALAAGAVAGNLAFAAEVHARTGAAAAALPPAVLPAVRAELQALPVDAALAVLAVLVDHTPALLDVAAGLAATDLGVALAWAPRLRTAGLPCPLLTLAAQADDASVRAVAAALAVEHFADTVANDLLVAALSAVAPAHRAGLLEVMADVAPVTAGVLHRPPT